MSSQTIYAGTFGDVKTGDIVFLEDVTFGAGGGATRALRTPGQALRGRTSRNGNVIYAQGAGEVTAIAGEFGARVQPLADDDPRVVAAMETAG